MRLGQTSLVVFASRLLGSALSFLAMLYFARTLGAEAFGVYGLVLTVVAWLKLGGSMGIGSALTKRISEGDEQGAFLSAGLVSVLGFGLVASLAVVVGKGLLEAYIGSFETYVAVSVVWVVVGLLLIRLFYTVVMNVLEGERKVHVAAVLDPIKFGTRSVIQIGLLLAGFGLAGMLIGYAIGGILIGLLGVAYVAVPLRRPARRHFRSLYEYARYSWLGTLKTRSFNDLDVLLLGVFVNEALVGIYLAAWNVSKFLDLFSGAIESTLFPEISRHAERGDAEATRGLIEDSLTFAGLIVVPGLFGGLLVGERLLAVYGPEFREGTTVLGLLLLGVLLYAYQKQLLNALNAIDRPDVSFRINLVFLATNATLNIVLIRQYGIVGAAVATVASVCVGVSLSYAALRGLVAFTMPIREIGRQLIAAGVMAIVVLGAREAGEGTVVGAVNEAFVILLVGLGAGVYVLVLLAISTTFRDTVRRNAPVDVPFL